MRAAAQSECAAIYSDRAAGVVESSGTEIQVGSIRYRVGSTRVGASGAKRQRPGLHVNGTIRIVESDIHRGRERPRRLDDGARIIESRSDATQTSARERGIEIEIVLNIEGAARQVVKDRAFTAENSSPAYPAYCAGIVERRAASEVFGADTYNADLTSVGQDSRAGNRSSVPSEALTGKIQGSAGRVDLESSKIDNAIYEVLVKSHQKNLEFLLK